MKRQSVAIVDRAGHSPSADYETADIAAMKALQAGVANEGQQKRAFDWFLYQAARISHVSYVPGDERATMFNEGRRFAGLAVVQLLKAQPIEDKP